MSEKYTIATAMPTGKNSPTYGVEYYIKFAESEETFKLWYKTPPTEGQVQEGEIDGWKFKKVKKEFISNETKTGEKPKRTYGAVEKDKQDGMRQGMCFNNAAAYVNSQTADPQVAEVWANTVWQYARALYVLGDLLVEEIPAVETPLEEAPKTVQDVFGATK